MRAFILVVSLMALVLGFLGATLGLRSTSVRAGTGDDVDRVTVLEERLEVVTEALADLERRFEEHVARSPAGAIPAAEPVEAPDDSVSEVVEETPPEAGDLLVRAALERADEHVAAGDAGGARALYTEILERSTLDAAARARARLGIAITWSVVGDDERARAELESLRAELGETEDAALREVLDQVRMRLEAGDDEE